MIENLTTIYEGDDLSGATSGVIYLPILRDGELQLIDILSDAEQTGDAVFLIKLNGVELEDAGVTIADGGRIGTVADLTVPLVKGDEITLDLVSGNVSAPVTLNLGVENGIETGGGETLPDGDLDGSTNTLQKIQTRAIAMPPPAIAVGDNFNRSGDVSTDDYYILSYSAGTIALNGTEVVFTSNFASGDVIHGIAKKGVINFVDKFIQVRLTQLSGSQPTWVFGLTTDVVNYYYFPAGHNGGADYKVGFAHNMYGVGAGTYCPLQQNGYGTSIGSAVSTLDAVGTLLRIEHVSADNKVYLKSSVDDGANWVTQRTVDLASFTELHLSAVYIYLGGGQYAAGASGNRTTAFDDLTTNIVLEDELEDKSIFGIWNASTNQFECITLVDLKAALDALP